MLDSVRQEMVEKGIVPIKMVLFGSYANGRVHAYSDVDVAVWSEQFSGESLEDFEKVKSIAQKYRPVSFKLFPADATSLNYDPFIEVIEKTGICIYEQEKQK
ncbi:MAG: nucleotidyltransferase domain-containing protein [Bacteroidota bacterium]|nr:nucleotidyltransferase domain-containing protein [Bacteroidota bacterium]